jgi:hypothetical protein
MNHKIIIDEAILEDFINNFLPDLEQDETFYWCLFARSKYCKDNQLVHINTDKAQLRRGTSNKSRLIDKLRQLECPVGSYKQKENVAPQESLALYINPNPRSNVKAAKNALIRLAHLITGENHGYNLHQEMISEVQKAKSRGIFTDFDFDIDESEQQIKALEWLKSEARINIEAYHVLQTRGGFHVLVESKKVSYEFNNHWHNDLRTGLQLFSKDVNNLGDNMIPIPGCTQGGFIPHFIK